MPQPCVRIAVDNPSAIICTVRPTSSHDGLMFGPIWENAHSVRNFSTSRLSFQYHQYRRTKVPGSWHCACNRQLRSIVPGSPSPLLYVDHVAADGTALYRAVCEHDLEGIVAKRADAPYTPDATTWVKIKNAAYSQAQGRHDCFDARAAGT